MREILFRGKYDNKWAYGYFIQSLDIENKPTKNCIIENMSSVPIGGGCVKQDYYEIELSTLGQYTGFKDKNGIKIFEGDIFVDQDEQIVSVVVFEDGCFQLQNFGWVERLVSDVAYNDFWEEIDCEPLCGLITENMEVISNIHDNPELLEVAE